MVSGDGMWSSVQTCMAVTVLATLIGLPACSTTATSRYRDIEVDLRSAVQASALGPRDLIHIRVYQHADLTADFAISPTGEIDFPLVGKLTVEGLVPSQVSALVKRKLSEGFIKRPHVNVQVKAFNSKKVFVLGKVKKPGRFTYSDSMTVIEAVTLAGGFGDLAERNYTIVTRAGRRIAVPVEKIMQGLAANFRLQPADIVYVPETIL